MDELFAKITNLSYEFFGVILPGLIAGLFIGLLWLAAGPLPPYITAGSIPELTINNIKLILDALNTNTTIVLIILSLIIAYFLGHLLLWIARFGKQNKRATESAFIRVLFSLTFRIPKPNNSYDPTLQPLYNIVQKRFAVDNKPLLWRQFYPVVKSYLSKNLSTSLVPTYQNKYTLHRSITLAATIWFWLNLITIVFSIYCSLSGGPSPYWIMLFILSFLALALVWGFSGSYLYHWQTFGDTIVTEAYSIIRETNNQENTLNPKNLVVIDIETSGTNPFRHEILSIGFVPFDRSLPSAEFYIKHTQIEWTDYAHNNFERFREFWEKKSLPPEQAYTAIEQYLTDTFSGKKVTSVGHNIGFDVAFLRKLAFQAGHDQISGLSHRVIDTHTLLYVLAERGKIPIEGVTSDGAFKYFNIDINEQKRHTALGDAFATRELLSHIFEQF
jgi:DNA polymerase III epsilon subunit-like protein